MDKEDIELGDWHRLLIGDNPWGFTLEVLGRTLVIYVCLVIVMRLLGKRMNAQLTIMNLAVMLMLGGIASVPMQAFDRGLLPGIILLVSILLLHKGITLLINKKRNIEILTQGKISLLIKNGVIDIDKLQSMRISKDQLFSVLRAKDVRHLGQVKKLYSEADGHFSLFKLTETRPGLTVFPRSEEGLPPEDRYVEDHKACAYCGNVIEKSHKGDMTCNNCGNEDWVPVIKLTVI